MGREKESLQRSLINFHCFSVNPGTPQGVKTVTANVPQIRKVTTACQVGLDSWGLVELFIYKSLSQNHWYVFFFHGDIELQKVRSDKNSLLWFSLRLLLKSRPYCSVKTTPHRNHQQKHHIFPKAAEAHCVWVRAPEVIWSEYTRIISVSVLDGKKVD